MGIALSALAVGNPFIGLQSAVVIVVLLAISLKNRRLPLLVLAFVAGVVFGVWRGGAEQLALKAYEPYYGKTVSMQGVVLEDATYNSRGQQQLKLVNIQIADQRLAGVVWLSGDPQPGIKRGDTLTVQGNLIKGFGNIPASLHRARLLAIERPVPGNAMLRFRDWFADGIRRAIPEPASSLSVGYLVGQKSALPEEVSQQLKVVGLTHVVVASGYNLTILVGFARRFFARYSKYLAALVSVLLVLSFMVMTGLSPSMSRAGLVALLGLAAWYYGRSMHPVVLLSFSAAITAVWRPAYVWGDIGWYLSFTAFAGVMILAPLLRKYFFGQKQLGVIRQTLMETTAAQILTLPIILYSFGEYATYALLANILVLPLVPLAMLFTFFAGVGGVILPGVASVFGWPARFILMSNLWVVATIARLPGASGQITFSLTAMIICYGALIGLLVYLWRTTNYNFRQSEEDSLHVF